MIRTDILLVALVINLFYFSFFLFFFYAKEGRVLYVEAGSH